MSHPTPIHIIPRDSEEEGDDGIIIENISTLQNGNIENNNDADVAAIAAAGSSDALSLSTATSATSIASALSNGEHRPRSASFNLPAATVTGDGRPNSTPRQRSTPRSRPRSNPRTRTPMRHESPLLVTGRATTSPLLVARVAASQTHHVNEHDVASDVISSNENNNEASATANENDVSSGGEEETNMIRSIFNTNRRHRSRAGSIPEEIVEEAVIESVETFESIEVVANESDNNQEVRIEPQTQTQTVTSTTAPRAAGHWLAQAATSRNTARSTNPSRTRGAHTSTGLSEKQRPSHRKIRRWNNDRFVGTSSEQIHVTLEQGDDTDMTDAYWREFYMPNYPCEYRSEFAKLSIDESKVGKNVRERFLKGEVAHHHHKGGKQSEKDNKIGGGKGWMERSVLAKFQKMGIPHAKNGTRCDEEMGKKLFHKLSPRIQSVLSRSCGNNNTTGIDEPSFASQVVTAFESYLTSLALAASKKDVISTDGYPPKQPEGTYELFEKMFADPPKVVMRNKKHKHNSKHLHAVLVPSVHFYFKMDDDNNNTNGGGGGGRSKGNGQANSTAFYRILLYAVCQFHGLESSSSVMAPNKKGNQQKGGSAKVVTVQGGVLLAPALKLLDFVE